MDLKPLPLGSVELPRHLHWVKKPESPMWWVSEVLYPDWLSGTPSPGDRVFIYDREHIFIPPGTS